MYFRSPSGKAAVGWEEIDGSVYGFSDEGILQTGWIERDGHRYYLDAQGRRQDGWQTIEGATYYLGDDGAMRTGWTQVDGKTYLLDENGHKLTGIQTVEGKKYFLDQNGAMKTGWVEEKGKYYYYDGKGVMQTGMITVDGEQFFLSEDGSVEPGWHEEEDRTFYVCSDGYVLDTEGETGSYGRLVIRGIGLDVQLFTAGSRDEYQEIVDRADSALVVEERRDVEPAIADRRSQGFDMEKVEKGSAAVVMYADGTVQEFTCIRKATGTNTGKDVIDEEGTSIWRQNEGGLCAYSHAGTGDQNTDRVAIVFWSPVDAGDHET